MEEKTYNELKGAARNLVLMKAVSSSSGESSSARPLAWVCLDPNNYGLDISIKWTEKYKCYTSTDEIISGATVKSTNAYDIKLGESFNVTNPNGTGKVDPTKGMPGSVFISNINPRKEGEPNLTCGIMQTIDDPQRGPVFSQLCAFPLLPKSAEIISPINKVFVSFASNIKRVGAVVEYSIHTGIMLEYIATTSREITFDIDQGFIPDTDKGTEVIEATPDLAKRLVLPSTNFVTARSNFISDTRIKEHEQAKLDELKKVGHQY